MAWFDNSTDRTTAEFQVSVRYCSIQTAASPIFRFSRSRVRMELEKSVIGPVGSEPTVLVATDESANLNWSGRENLYGKVASFLLPLGTAKRGTPIVTFADWIDATNGIREIRSQTTEKRIWGPPDPGALLDRPDPSAAFALAEVSNDVGARRGPNALFVRIGNSLAGLFDPSPVASKRTTPEPLSQSGATEKANPEGSGTQTTALAEQKPNAQAPMEVRTEDVNRSPMIVGTAEVESIRPMIQANSDSVDLEANRRTTDDSNPSTTAVAVAGEKVLASSEATNRTRIERTQVAVQPGSESNTRVREAHTGTELRSILQSSLVSGEMRVLVNSPERLTLSPINLMADSHWEIEGQASGRRSIIELQASRPAERESLAAPALFSIPTGASLELVDLDIVLPRDQRPANGRWSIFSIEPGGSLKLRRCTLTLEGNQGATIASSVPSALIRLVAGFGASGKSTKVQVEDCVLRAEGDIIEETSGHAADFSFVNSIVSSGGRLLHGKIQSTIRQGSDLGISLKLRQSTARVLAGLVFLEADSLRARIPRVLIEASDSILSTGDSGWPLLRVEGQSDLESLADRITWEGQRVVYHDIDVYRRDESAKAGESTVGKSRASWEVAVRDHDDAPFHGDARFLRPPDSDTPPWDLSPVDLRLAPESPVPMAGPRMDQLPTPPPGNH